MYTLRVQLSDFQLKKEGNVCLSTEWISFEENQPVKGKYFLTAARKNESTKHH